MCPHACCLLTDWSAPLAFEFQYAPPCYTCQAPKDPVCTKTPVMELYYVPELANVTKTNYSINRTTGWVNETITSMVNETVNETTSLVNVTSIVTKLANITTNVSFDYVVLEMVDVEYERQVGCADYQARILAAIASQHVSDTGVYLLQRPNVSDSRLEVEYQALVSLARKGNSTTCPQGNTTWTPKADCQNGATKVMPRFWAFVVFVSIVLSTINS
jgi:hypothetical protein